MIADVTRYLRLGMKRPQVAKTPSGNLSNFNYFDRLNEESGITLYQKEFC
jgi:hypothetical protein